MGHAFQDTLMDALIRYQRMRGCDTLWQGGTDHAGIATQLLVERQLAANGQSRAGMGRDAFVREVWNWKHRSGNHITRQLRRLGASIDWSRERFTLSEELSGTVREVFVRLYREDLIYRGKRLVNWDPVLGTAVSDLEIQPREIQGKIWSIRYPLAGDDTEALVVATTRPETLLGDTAVAVHPQDERYRHLIGARVRVPLTDRDIPVIADDAVDPEFGSGCVKVTPAHDFNDYCIGLRHQLPMITIFHPDASINEQAPPAYRGLDRERARQRVLEDLQRAGLLVAEREHAMTVPHGDRSGAVIEPMLTDQWFVRTAPLAAPAIEAVRQGRVRFIPDNWSKTYFEWMHHIEDWCISRQIWWGHRIPAWYDEQGRIHVAHDEAEARRDAGLAPDAPLRQDEDVLDTWFSSALWPFSTLGWPERTPELQRFYPTTVLVTGFDIIFFWVARMIMMGLKCTGEVPFREVYIHGLVRDAKGNKMSKSKGNTLDPLDLIDGITLTELLEKRTAHLMRPEDAEAIRKATRQQFPQGINAHGADALRFCFASLASGGRDIRFDTGRIHGFRNFCDKIWNAARYVLRVHEGAKTGGQALVPGLPERWIRARLGYAIRRVDEAMATYRFDLAAQAVHALVRDEYCDWYLEFSKTALAREQDAAVVRQTLVEVLEAALRLMHPLMPFISEELWQRIAPLGNLRVTSSIMQAPWPRAEDFPPEPEAEAEIGWLCEAIAALRRLRSENRLPPSARLQLMVCGGSEDERAWLQRQQPLLLSMAGLSALREVEQAPPGCAVALAGGVSLLAPLSELVDRDAELQRLSRDISRYECDYAHVRKSLDNPDFVRRAPETVVTEKRRRFDELERDLKRLRVQYRRLESGIDA